MSAIDQSQSNVGSIGIISTDPEGALPEDSIPLSTKDVYRLRLAQIRSWKSRSESWPIVFGPSFGTLAVSLSSFVINISSRSLFQVYSQTYFWPTLLPTVIFSTAAYWLSFERLIRRPILTQIPTRSGSCDLCLELRGSVIQLICGSVLPSAVSFITCSIAAVTERTYPVPSLGDPKALWFTVKRFGRSMRVSGPLMLLGHAFLGCALTHAMLKTNRLALTKEHQGSGDMIVYPPLSADF
ncbi:hypothetical protein P879_06495 [Paragonimus westermani]|uniref:Transmembrane protein 126A n=1 Tax=Paragonimus westermani TaxID=34504 RepID=A0A8T0DLW0_9TREM|nr:hypothetical protein P879_06495 [Paragonimus westermani]